MPLESLRQRLEALNRERLPTPIVTPPTQSAKPSSVSPSKSLVARAKGELLASAVVCENAGGEHLLIPIAVDDLWPGGERLVLSRVEHVQSLPTDQLASGMNRLIAAMPDGALLLDLETCGLGGSALFLIGLLRMIDGRLTVELLLANNYTQERAVLEALWQRLDAAEVLVTFNGKSFDWPTVLDRSRRHLLHRSRTLREELPHLDALHPARRRWKGRLPDCRLQTIERLICRRSRVGDIPGAQIPAAYDAYVRTGRPTEMEAILHHNALDLVTLLDITMRLVT